MRALATSLVVLVLAACGASTGTPGMDAGVSSEPLADFSLLDVNPASPSANTHVGPRQFEGRVSAWYFGHSS